MFLSIIIPARNEEKRIGVTLESINSYLKKQDFDYEIIVVANNCQDRTCDVVRSFKQKIFNLRLINLEKNKGGKGLAVKYGIMAAEGDYLLFMDADNSTRICELNNFLPYIDNYQILIGSRVLKGAKIVIRQSKWREFFGRCANFFVQLFLLPKIYDTQCGFKLFKREAGKRIFSKQKILGFGFDLEILALARYFGFKIKEIPISWYNSPRSHVSFWHYFTTFWELLKIKWNFWKGEYNK